MISVGLWGGISVSAADLCLARGLSRDDGRGSDPGNVRGAAALR